MRSLRFGKSIAVLILVLVGVGCLPVVAVLPWRWIDPPTSAFMLRASVEGTDVDRTWVDWDSIAPEMVVAVIAAEDQRFLDHHGFDFAAIREAMAEDRPRRRGASTLTQQVAKNLFLWPAHSWFRKGLEAALTVWIEVLWPKRRILEIYLNTAELGPGVYGVEAASRRFFEKSAAELTTGEAALLAAVLPSPVKLSAARPSAYVERRAAWIRRQMRQLGGRALLAGV